MLYFADIQSLEKELHSEMECVCFFDELPTEWTYPLIQPLLIKEYLRRMEKLEKYKKQDYSDNSNK